MYVFLDKFFIVFHTLLILFNLFGWIWPKTRRANLAVLLLTVFSWVVLGMWYGIGYCPFTEWHWQVRYALGHHDMPYSYITFLLESLTGLRVNPTLVDILTAIIFGLALLASLITNVRDWKANRTGVSSV